jgi:hypothetical protein
MRKTAIAFGIAAVITGYVIPRVHASTGPIPLNCNRVCLEGVMDQYLAALVAHDPKRLPLSADAIYTENDQIMDIGDGFWKTVQGLGNYKHIFADPEFGQVAMMETIREAGAVLLLSLRLRIELGRITEIESVYYRTGGGGPSGIPTLDAPGYKPEDMWLKSIPAAQRPTRQEMIAVADGYFTGLQKNDGKGINGTGTYPFTTDCHRIENGAPTTTFRALPTSRRTPSTASPWIAWRSSGSATISWCRTFTTAAIPSWITSAAWSGRTRSSIRARLTRVCSRMAASMRSKASTGPQAFWLMKLS